MKRLIFIVVVFLLGAVYCEGAENVPGTQIIVYYFHGNFRCPTCYKIERYTEEAITQYFQKELQSGRVVFKPTNIELNANQHFIKDYQLFAKAVVLSLRKDGKEVQFNNLSKIWEYVGDKEKFYDYIKTETAKYLEGIK